MLRPAPEPNHPTHHHRDRVKIDGFGWGTGLGIDYPPGEGWAVTHVGGVRFCAWYRSAS